MSLAQLWNRTEITSAFASQPLPPDVTTAAIAAFFGLLFAATTLHAKVDNSTPGESERMRVFETGTGCQKVECGNARATTKPRVIERGYLIANARYVPPPYVVRRTGQRLYVNGVSLDEDSSAGRTIEQMERRLAKDGVIIKFHDGSIALFYDALVLELMLKETVPSAKVGSLMPLANSIPRSQWFELVDEFEPTEDLKERIHGFVDCYEQRFDTIPSLESTSGRFKFYVLTVIGMTLTVLSFGVVLSHRPQFTARWADVDGNWDSVRVVFGWLVLIVLLSLFDLACSLAAENSAGFWELNPLGAAIAGRPVSLIVFKLIATICSVSILLGLRVYRGVQVACWWLCVGLTLLAARWVVFNSLLMG